MKNIDHYCDAIAEHLKTKSVLNLGCAVFDIRTGTNECGDCDCEDCCIKSIKWLNEEYEEPKNILTGKEKEIVRAMCDIANKSGRDVIYVSKFIDDLNGVYIYCKIKNKENDNTDFIETPWLPKNTFKGMDDHIRYTPEELGLENVNG